LNIFLQLFEYFHNKIFLSKHGAELNNAGGQGITPLMWACIRDHKELIKDFLTRGANYSLESVDSKEKNA